MKRITKITHKIIQYLGLDSTIANFAGKVPLIHKLIPTNGEYGTDKPVIVHRGGVVFKLHLNDYMQWHIFANIKEPLWSFAWNFLQKECTILDVGANVGAFSLKTARYLHKPKAEYYVHAFEPNKKILKCFNDNLALNPDLTSYVNTYPLALSDAIGTLFFESNIENSGISKISNSKKGNRVEATTIDEFAKSRQLERVDLLKIDVEGYEPRVLNGAKQVISAHKPIIILEVTDKWFQSEGSSATEIIAMLSTSGYSFYSDISGDAKKFNHDTPKPIPFQFNLLAIHDKRV